MPYGSPQTGKSVQFESVTVEDKPEAGGVHSYSGSTDRLVTDSNSSENSDDNQPTFEKNSDGEVIQSLLNKKKIEI